MRPWLAILVFVGACGGEAQAPRGTTESGLEVADFLGQPGRLELRANHPFRAEYPVLKWDGVKLISSPTTRRDSECYFFGDLTLDGQLSSAAVALRTCDVHGNPLVSGVAFYADHVFQIVQTAAGLEFIPTQGAHGTCGVQSTPVIASDSETRTQQFALSSGEPAFIEVLLGQDEALLSGVADGDYAPDPVMTVHAAAAFYDRTNFGRRILPILVGVIDATDTNPWGAAPFFLGRARAGGYVSKINDWAVDNAATLPEFDQLTVLSGYNFTGSTVGLANVSSACDLGRSAAVVKGLNNDASVAQTFGHELGHTIGMYHDSDGNSCPRSGFVMTPVYNANGPFAAEFSTCSIDYADPFLASSDSSCITQDAQAAHPIPFCGDGKVEGAEVCDCGPLGCEGRQPCCTDTCGWAPGCGPTDPEPVDMGVDTGSETLPDSGVDLSDAEADTSGEPAGDDAGYDVSHDPSPAGTDSGCATTSASSNLLPLVLLVGLFMRRRN